MLLSEGYRISVITSYNEAVTMASSLLSNVIPLPYVVKEYYHDYAQLKHFDSTKVFQQLNRIEETLKRVEKEEWFIEDELRHVFDQLEQTFDLLYSILEESEAYKLSIGDEDIPF